MDGVSDIEQAGVSKKPTTKKSPNILEELKDRSVYEAKVRAKRKENNALKRQSDEDRRVSNYGDGKPSSGMDADDFIRRIGEDDTGFESVDPAIKDIFAGVKPKIEQASNPFEDKRQTDRVETPSQSDQDTKNSK